MELNPRFVLQKNVGEQTKTMLRLTVSGDLDLLQIHGPKTINTNQFILMGMDFLTKDQGIYTFDINGNASPKN